MKSDNLPLFEIEVLLVLQHPLHPEPVHLFIGLGTGGPHRLPFRMFRIRNWMPVASMFLAISPPSASISLTRCPLASPPTAGLHDMRATASRLMVSSSVRRPMLAAASAASQPAWPAPTTITSYVLS